MLQQQQVALDWTNQVCFQKLSFSCLCEFGQLLRVSVQVSETQRSSLERSLRELEGKAQLAQVGAPIK
jgi:hypothetical protein